MTVTFQAPRCEVELLDGAVTGEDLRDYDLPGVLRSTYHAQDAALTLVLQGVGEIVAEVGGRLGSADPLEERAAVSLTKTTGSDQPRPARAQSGQGPPG
jgi:hypothetical protein